MASGALGAAGVPVFVVAVIAVFVLLSAVHLVAAAGYGLVRGVFEQVLQRGAACFAPGSGLTLVYNHGIGGSERNPVPATDPAPTYDPGAGGCTTDLEMSRSGERLREYASVVGTVNNCAGGATSGGCGDLRGDGGARRGCPSGGSRLHRRSPGHAGRCRTRSRMRGSIQLASSQRQVRFAVLSVQD
jgi:hypothetical protein